MKYIILAFFLTGCGKFVALPYHDKELKPFITEFEELYNIKVNYTVKFGEINKNNTVAVCKTQLFFDIGDVFFDNSYKKRTIIVDKEFFNRLSFYGKHQLMFHEFGHCSLNRGHTDKRDSLGRPISIMYPYVFGYYSYYSDNLDAYLNELWVIPENNEINVENTNYECYIKIKE